MTDVEIITERNQRAARERELGERWNEIVRLQKKQRELLKAAETTFFSVGCMMTGAAAVFLGIGMHRTAFAIFGMAACFFLGAMLVVE